MNALESLRAGLMSGRINRREFIRRATAMGLAAAVPAALASRRAAASGPARGGHLRQIMRGGSVSNTLSGLGESDTHLQNTTRQILSNLTEILPDGSVAGELAESWEPSADAATWAFKLRRGVEFHNGKSLEAEDVVYSINLHRGEETRSTAKGLIADVADVKADGRDTVVFTLQSGSSDLPSTLTDMHFAIKPAGASLEEMEKGIGTGPFVLKEWKPGIASATERNPNYFKEGLPYFDSVESIHAGDVAARQNALLTGQVDVMDDPDLKTIDRLLQAENVAVQETPGTKHYTFPMLMDQPPFDDFDLRMALKYAIDRQAILDTVLRGHGYVGNDHPVARSMQYFADELPQREHDIDKAKFHLKKAGYASLDLKLHAGDIYSGGVDSAVLFKEQAAKAGINIEIQRMPTDGYWSEVWNKVPFCVSYTTGRPTANGVLTLLYASDSPWNETHWTNERFDSLLVQARKELDEAKRRDMYVEMQRIIRDEGGLIAPVFGNVTSATSTRVWVPETLAGNWVLDGCKNTERWGFAA